MATNATFKCHEEVSAKQSSDDNNVLDKRSREILKSSCALLATNVPITTSMCQFLVEQRVLNNLTAESIHKESNIISKMSLILESIKMRHDFATFCDILTICGHPLIADFLRNEIFETSDSIEIFEFVHEIPILQSLQKCEMQALCDLILSKLQSVMFKTQLKNSLSIDKSAGEIKEKYVKQSWKHLKEMTEQTLSIKEMKHSVSILETSVKEKIAEIKNIKESMKMMKEQHLKEQAVSNRFNMANDKTLRHLQEKLDNHVDLMNFIDNKLQMKNLVNKPFCAADEERNSSPNKLQLEGIRDVFTKFMKYVEELEDNVLEAQVLRSNVAEIVAYLDRESNATAFSLNLSVALDNYTACMEEKFRKQSAEIKLLEDFIHQKLTDSEIPESLRDVSLPAELRVQLENRVNQLVKEVENQQSLLVEREVHIKQLEIDIQASQQRSTADVNIDTLDSEMHISTPAVPLVNHFSLENKRPSNPIDVPYSPTMQYPLRVVERQAKAKRLLVQEVSERKKPIVRLEADYVLQCQPIRTKDIFVVSNQPNQRLNIEQPSNNHLTKLQTPIVPYSSPSGTLIVDAKQKYTQPPSGFRNESKSFKNNPSFKLLLHDSNSRALPSLPMLNVSK